MGAIISSIRKAIGFFSISGMGVCALLVGWLQLGPLPLPVGFVQQYLVETSPKKTSDTFRKTSEKPSLSRPFAQMFDRVFLVWPSFHRNPCVLLTPSQDVQKHVPGFSYLGIVFPKVFSSTPFAVESIVLPAQAVLPPPKGHRVKTLVFPTGNLPSLNFLKGLKNITSTPWSVFIHPAKRIRDFVLFSPDNWGKKVFSYAPCVHREKKGGVFSVCHPFFSGKGRWHHELDGICFSWEKTVFFVKLLDRGGVKTIVARQKNSFSFQSAVVDGARVALRLQDSVALFSCKAWMQKKPLSFTGGLHWERGQYFATLSSKSLWKTSDFWQLWPSCWLRVARLWLVSHLFGVVDGFFVQSKGCLRRVQDATFNGRVNMQDATLKGLLTLPPLTGMKGFALIEKNGFFAQTHQGWFEGQRIQKGYIKGTLLPRCKKAFVRLASTGPSLPMIAFLKKNPILRPHVPADLPEIQGALSGNFFFSFPLKKDMRPKDFIWNVKAFLSKGVLKKLDCRGIDLFYDGGPEKSFVRGSGILFHMPMDFWMQKKSPPQTPSSWEPSFLGIRGGGTFVPPDWLRFFLGLKKDPLPFAFHETHGQAPPTNNLPKKEPLMHLQVDLTQSSVSCGLFNWKKTNKESAFLTSIFPRTALFQKKNYPLFFKHKDLRGKGSVVISEKGIDSFVFSSADTRKTFAADIFYSPSSFFLKGWGRVLDISPFLFPLKTPLIFAFYSMATV